ncbi:MAG TPA: 3-phosphoshikimate 1-carboxyvinyltransferase [Clostridiales bacterium]|nr:3-phosphoshikimate 1-carboxyvinyltransferase [Clostridiales bacterium]
MDSIKITPGRLAGSVTVPSSKSAAHRAIACALLAGGKARLENIDLSDDVIATISAAKALGCNITLEDNTLTIERSDTIEFANIDCIESGTTLRFFIPIAAALGIKATFTGKGRLPQRPIKVLTDLLESHGVKCSNDSLPLTIEGNLTGGNFYLPGNISSQFISGLLLALPLTGQDCQVILTTPLESAGYVEMTIDIMNAFGVKVEKTESGYYIKPGQEYKSNNFFVEGDWSQAAFFMAAAAIGGDITIHGLNRNSTQGDKAAAEIFQRFGADITFLENGMNIKHKDLKGIEIDASQIPDLVPALAVTAAFAKGTTRIHSASRLRLKESDRLAEIAKNLKNMGINVTETYDELIIEGGKPKGAEIDSAGDHRIAMAFSVAASYSEPSSIIKGYSSINKSYPLFYQDFKKLGGKANVL